MKLKCFPFIILFLIVVTQLVLAGTTGKIIGVVTDKATGEPLPGANVVVEGTSIGAASDLSGTYIILNVPPGVYSLTASMMGYKERIVENVRVSIDLTTTINMPLEETVLEAGETVTVVAEKPLVKMDMTSSLSAVGSEEIKALPVTEVSDVLELQAGVIKTGNDLHIRGGRAGEVAYWVDGVATTDVFGGGMGVRVENSAVEELQVISGTFNAEYGQAMSGIINIITKEGRSVYNGQIKTYVGDYISNGDEFSVLKTVTPTVDAQTGSIVLKEQKENPLKNFNPNYDAEFSLSGPVPIVGNKLTFFANGRYLFDEGHLYGREWFTPDGTPGDSSLVPMNPYSRYSTQGKLTWAVNPNMKLSYNVFWNKWDQDRYYDQNYKYEPDGVPERHGTGTTQIFSLNHVLSPSTFYELRVNRLYNEFKQYVFEDPYAKPDYLIWVYPDSAGGVGYQLDPNDPADQELFAQIKAERKQFDYIIDPNGPLGYVHPDSATAPASYSFYKVGMNMDHYKRSTAYWVGKLDLSSQVNNQHQLKAGTEVRFHELTLDQFTLRPKTIEGTGEQIVPFEPSIPDISTVYHNKYDRKPREFSAYAQDKIELKNIIINAGLRFDYFDANTNMPVDPEDPNIYYPYKNEHIYKNYVPPSEPLSGQELAQYLSHFTEYTPEERRAFMQKKVDAKTQISPRLGIAYPITDKGVIHFSYGHFFQIPDFQYLYSNPDFKLSPQGGYTIFGNPDLHPQRTVMYEIGLQQQLTSDIGLDATLFYRDVRDWVGTSPLISTPIPTVKYSQYENKDYMNVRGITVKLEKRMTNNFSARLDYSFQIIEGTYSNPNDAYNAYQAQEEPRLSLLPLNWDQNHTLNGSVVFRVSEWIFSFIGRYWTGMPYTPDIARGETVGGAALIGLRENSERLPDQKSVDLLINRQFSVGKLDLNFFINVYNLFDQRDETAVYGDTGTARYTTQINPSTISYNSKRIGTIEDYVNQPGWYTTPRQVQIGMTIGF
jgi:outer membrane receptor for ferrienterochelin and colicin